MVIDNYYTSEKGDFNYSHSTDYSPDKSNFTLHTHSDHCEIIIFIKGNSEFRAEGSIYKLNSYDIAISHSTEMHIICHNKPVTPYERVVLHIKNSFFIQNGCERFLDLFTNRALGENNIISHNSVSERNISQTISDIDKYISENDSMMHKAIEAKVIDLLYNLYKMAPRNKEATFYNDKIKDVIMYINNNISSTLSINDIADNFFISKYYLCHIFKEYSGLTINKYITLKRIMLVKELVAKGWSIINASMEAGFGSYSNFYKAFLKETGKPPKDALKIK